MDTTHEGYMHYIYRAWANELGVVIKPEDFFYTVISEIKTQIIKTPDTYKHLFTQSESKTQIIIVGLNVENLMDALESMIPCKDLFDTVTKTSFSTEPAHYKRTLGIAMADMGTPYYDYTSTKCGIPKVAVLGDISDWNTLVTSLEKLTKVFECCQVLTTYLGVVTTLVNTLIKAAFHDKNNEWFSNMFSYYNNPRCMSGHSPVVIDGWIKDLYIETHDYIASYPSHINCLPYNDEDDLGDVKYYVYMAGLTSSQIVDGYLYPEYNIAQEQIVHPQASEIFKMLSAK